MKELITIIFYGIITHVDLHPAAMNTAVLPAVMYHKAYLCVSASEISGTAPTGTFIAPPSSTNPGCPNQYEIDLTYATVKFKNIDENRVLYTEEYRRYVPSLTSISKCRKLKSNVRSRTHAVGMGPDTKIAAYVDYPGGILDVESYFAGRGKLDPADPDNIQNGPQCFACKVKLTMATNAKTVRIILTRVGTQGEIPFDVLSMATLTVRNAPTQATQDHFKYHYDIFDSSDAGCKAVVIKKANEKCDLVVCAESSLESGGGSDADVECSNTNFP
jgi:hypothetical protein